MLHGRQVAYAEAGSGPVLLLIHGMGGTLANWQVVIELLAREHTVIAPDLPGHGASAPGAGDYSIGALAAGLRDLLVALGHDRATLVGHSLGGGIAMQFAYQFPEATERLVLVSSGGLGSEVSRVLRAAALPGAKLFIAATAGPGRAAGSAVARALGAVGLQPKPDLAEVGRAYASLARSSAPAASASMPPTGSTSPRGSPFSSSGGSAIPSFRFATAKTPAGRCRAAALRSSTGPVTCRSSRSPGASSRWSAGSCQRPSPRSEMPGSGARACRLPARCRRRTRPRRH